MLNKYMNVGKISISVYKDAFPKFYPEFSDKIKWLPHHVNTGIFKGYGKKKDIDMLLMGATNPYYYPLRYKIILTYISKNNFVFHPHPGYKILIRTNSKMYLLENVMHKK